MAPPTFDQLRQRYANFWRDMKSENIPTLDQAATARLRNKTRYEKVGKQLGIPWWFIAILHHRESSGDFRGVLHNGEHIIGTGRKTKLVPAGRGPFMSWEEAAVDALRLKGLHNIRDWTVERVCYEAERFNGFGYFFRGVPSAYLWSFSNIYLGGKYVADGVWDSSARDQQIGVMPLLKRMMAQDATIKFGRFVPGSGAAEGGSIVVIIGTGGALATKEATKAEPDYGHIALIAFITVALALGAFIIIRKIRSRQKA